MDKKTYEYLKAGVDFLILKSEKCYNCRYRGYKPQNKAYCRYYTKDCNSLISAIVDKKFTLGGYSDIPIVYSYKVFINKMRNYIIKKFMFLKSRIKIAFKYTIDIFKRF